MKLKASPSKGASTVELSRPVSTWYHPGQVVPKLQDHLRVLADEIVEEEVPGRELSTSPTRLMLRAAIACTRREPAVRWSTSA
jgi:hypothetical protein